MYDELIKALRCEHPSLDCESCNYNTGDDCDYKRLTDDAADAIKELQQTVEHYKGCADDWYKEACDYKAMMPRWIPVTERLPEEETPVLVFTEHSNILTDRLLGVICNTYADFVKCGTNSVTHWMPLPQPPKEEETE